MTVTVEAIEGLITSENYWQVPGDAVMVCALTLWNEYTVIGWAACVDPANFDLEIGKRMSREDAMRQVVPLVGYEMASRRKWLKDHPADLLDNEINGLA